MAQNDTKIHIIADEGTSVITHTDPLAFNAIVNGFISNGYELIRFDISRRRFFLSFKYFYKAVFRRKVIGPAKIDIIIGPISTRLEAQTKPKVELKFKIGPISTRLLEVPTKPKVELRFKIGPISTRQLPSKVNTELKFKIGPISTRQLPSKVNTELQFKIGPISTKEV